VKPAENATTTGRSGIVVEEDADNRVTAHEDDELDMFGKRRQHVPVDHGHDDDDGSWMYENRVTIALLSVWMFCAVVYIGYNYKCVGDACFGWMPCYRRLTGADNNPEG
jgi:hypothetical protein